MFDLFGVSWGDLELKHVTEFLAGADEEGINWEAKADDHEGKSAHVEGAGKLRKDSIYKAVSGLANQMGGFLIVGARFDKKAREWQVVGVDLGVPEPGLWLGEVCRALRPVPRFDVKVWPLDADAQRIVAVVNVEPVDDPPCMTPRGDIYQRVPAATPRVDDPALLAQLIARGQHARARAELAAQDIAGGGDERARWGAERSACVSIGLASVGRETLDISSRIFSQTFEQQLVRASHDLYTAGTASPPHQTITQKSNAIEVIAREHGPDQAFLSGAGVRASWDGAIGVYTALGRNAFSGLSPIRDLIVPGVAQAAALLQDIGGHGATHLTVVVDRWHGGDVYFNNGTAVMAPSAPPIGSIFARMPKRTIIGRWLETPEPLSDTVAASIQREFLRAAGTPAYEPEPAPSPSGSEGS